jgi:hypothetical protein
MGTASVRMPESMITEPIAREASVMGYLRPCCEVMLFWGTTSQNFAPG